MSWAWINGLTPGCGKCYICDKFWGNIEIWYPERPNGTRYFQNTLLIIAKKFCDMSRHHFLSRKFDGTVTVQRNTIKCKLKVFPFLIS